VRDYDANESGDPSEITDDIKNVDNQCQGRIIDDLTL